jgi:SAM-dependent methyltransferase
VFEPGKYFGGREVDKCRERLQVYCEGVGLDIGCGSTDGHKGYGEENKIKNTAIGFDRGFTNLTGYANDLHWFKDGSLDYIFSSHLLEHIEKPEMTLLEWWRVLKDGGMLVMYLPLKDHYPSAGSEFANKDHKHDLDPIVILGWLRRINAVFDIVHIAECIENDEYSFDFVVRKKMLKFTQAGEG